MIYCVEDDSNIRELIVYTLNNTGYEAKGFEDFHGFYEAVEAKVPQLILLDIMLPEKDGISILKELRQNKNTQQTPIILLTAKSAEYDKVIGLDTGADDYITKPFGMMELISRIKAVLRRINPPQEQATLLTYGALSVDTKSHEVYLGKTEVGLTLKEYEILVLLLKNKDRVFTRDMLLDQIWGYDYTGETRTVDVHIRTLRQKLQQEAEIIQTVRGVGYKIGEKR